jgi:Peptidase family M28
MRTTPWLLLTLVVALAGAGALGLAQAPAGRGRGAQPPGPTPAAGRGAPQPPVAVFKLQDNFLQWRLLPSEKAYEAIDGKHLMEYVNVYTAISRRYRDAGHPQFWGRIIGSSADQENQQWLLNKFTQIGLSDVHLQPFDLAPQWMPQSWEVTATGGGKTLKLETAQPSYGSVGTTGSGLDLEVVYGGLGSEADFAGRDVRGKAVLLFSMPLPGSWRHTATAEQAIRRAQDKGAAAIICSIQLPGNIRTQLYPTNTNVPTFSMGMNDGLAFRDMIGSAPLGQAPTLKVRLDIQMVPGLKTATVWGTLPGATDETIYILGHRDGWFESATDNASGVATMVGLAEFFAKVPKAQRRRTIVFLGTSGHHNSANMSGTYLLDHRDELFAKTALMINAEHTATALPTLFGETIRLSNTASGMLWYGGGNERPKLQDATVKAFQEFGVPIYAEPERGAPGGEMSRLWPYVPGVQASDYNMFFHSDAETADTVPPPGLAATTRAYAKIIEEANKLDLKDLQVPAPAPTTAARD